MRKWQGCASCPSWLLSPRNSARLNSDVKSWSSTDAQHAIKESPLQGLIFLDWMIGSKVGRSG